MKLDFIQGWPLSKRPLIAILEKDVLKNPWKMSLWEFIFRVLVKPVNLLRMNFFKNEPQKIDFN